MWPREEVSYLTSPEVFRGRASQITASTQGDSAENTRLYLALSLCLSCMYFRTLPSTF